MTKIEEFLSECERLERGATKGPWRFHHMFEGLNARLLSDGRGYMFGASDDVQNGEWIASARTALPRAVAALRVAIEPLRRIAGGDPTAPYIDCMRALAEIERILTGEKA